ncbi:chemotaxis protein CheA [Gymnodinialimonas sp. 2305UL16-5]|uniref:chemotaxis protein CheA n=1 Tax=Gymnodinialimonas mytili TaxID=3126503 RepID=UPI0030AC7CEE
MSGGTDEFRASFFEECEDLLEAMHDGFGLMQNGDGDDETIHVIFRAVHSVKGGAGAFGLDDLVGFAHHFETALDMVRAGKAQPDPDLLSLFQQCGDHLSDLVSAARDEATIDASDSASLTARLDEVIGANGAGDEGVSDAAENFEPMSLDLDAMFDIADPSKPTATGHQISFVAEPELFTSGNEPALLFRALERFGQAEVVANSDDVPPLSALDPTTAFMSWDIRIDTDAAEDVLRDVFDFVSDCAQIEFKPLYADRQADLISSLGFGPGVPEMAPEEVTAASEEGAPAEDVLALSDETDVHDHDPTSPAEPTRSQADAHAQTEKSTPKTPMPQTIRVDFERVDKLINLVGELVIKEAMLSQSVASLDLATGSDVLLELESLKQLAGEIQEGVMSIRAQPIKPLFQRMARTIRDASSMTGKRVKLVMKGETAEVDKTVLERLVDPLTHMVRNAVDHGLEDRETRLAAGKPAEGTVTLSAAHRSGRVVIEISDDGGGIDRDRVRQIAESKGLISPDAVLTPSEVDGLLFRPGFSSKEEVSELSGRGVGLDVAKSEIVALGGRLTIQSEPGKGSVFSISLPLTLAVLEGMVVDVAGQTMVVPITAIHETLQPATAKIHTIGSGGHVLSIRDTLVPIADLGAIFGFRDPPAELDDHVLLIIETETERRCALIVDALQDQRQVVIKSLETNYTSIDGVAAATILGDGRIALIVDPEGVAGGIAPAPGSVDETLSHQNSGGDFVTA